MLSASELSVFRDGRKVLHDISLEVVPGEVLAVLGPNGAGKSSLLAALCGEHKHIEGECLLDGRDLSGWSGIERARRMAVLPQQSTLEFAFTVMDVVAMGRMPHATGIAIDQVIVHEVLHELDIAHLAERNYLTLSGGERQRVHLARVMAQIWPGTREQFLLLDEPTSMLDPLHQHALLQAVRRMAAKGVGVVIVLHDLNLAARYCDRLLLLRDGRLLTQGAVADVLTPQWMREVFGLDVVILQHPVQGCPQVVVR